MIFNILKQYGFIEKQGVIQGVGETVNIFYS